MSTPEPNPSNAGAEEHEMGVGSKAELVQVQDQPMTPLQQERVMSKRYSKEKPDWRAQRLFLNKREAEIAALVCQGLTNGQIGRQLFMTEDTIKTYLQRIYRAWNVENRVALVIQCVHRGLVVPDPGKITGPTKATPHEIVTHQGQSYADMLAAWR
jgi:DNA-binding CsgD family transcriptional regulator